MNSNLTLLVSDMKRFNKDGTRVEIIKQAPLKIITSDEKRKLSEYFANQQDFLSIRDKMIFSIVLMAGLKVEEITHLDVGDVLPKKKVITLANGKDIIVDNDVIPIVRLNEIYLGIHISFKLRQEIDAYVIAKEKQGESLHPDAPLFCSVIGKRLSYRSIQSVVSRRCVEAGLVETAKGSNKMKALYSIEELRNFGW